MCLESSETLQGCKERWFGGAQRSKVWRGKSGARPLWVSALVTLCRAERSADDSQGWVTLDNKTAAPGGFWWVWEALLRVVFPAGVVH